MASKRALLVARGASIGPTSLIGLANLNGHLSRLRVKDGSFVGRATIALHDLVEIGSCVCINDDVTILTASHDVTDPDWRMFRKPIAIDDFAWIATGALLLPGVRVGRGAVVGAGAVVSKDVPPYAIAVGNPARILEGKRTREFRYNPVRFLAFQEAWLGLHYQNDTTRP